MLHLGVATVLSGSDDTALGPSSLVSIQPDEIQGEHHVLLCLLPPGAGAGPTAAYQMGQQLGQKELLLEHEKQPLGRGAHCAHTPKR